MALHVLNPFTYYDNVLCCYDAKQLKLKYEPFDEYFVKKQVHKINNLRKNVNPLCPCTGFALLPFSQVDAEKW